MFKKSKTKKIIQQEEIPKDLGLKVGTHEEVFWTEVLKTNEARLEGAKKDVKLAEAVVEMCKQKIKDSK